jgi:hypothetical protein
MTFSEPRAAVHSRTSPEVQVDTTTSADVPLQDSFEPTPIGTDFIQAPAAEIVDEQEAFAAGEHARKARLLANRVLPESIDIGPSTAYNLGIPRSERKELRNRPDPNSSA